MSGIGVNLRVTGHCSQGGRKYMEDMFSVAYQQTADLKDLEYAFFGIYDGHGGPQAATFAKEHLLDSIVTQRSFWSSDDEDVLRAIRDGYISTHNAMWKDLAADSFQKSKQKRLLQVWNNSATVPL
ncbi:Protein phosphatase 1D [Homalodisca vitripennis]|nr:Protein phosphatase 1D [Homalodisca vitripennis]